MSAVEFNEALGRLVRVGEPEALGVPTSTLAVRMLAGGSPQDARDLVTCLVSETERIYEIFSTWLGEIQVYAEAHLTDAAAQYARLEAELGCPPPLQREADLPEGLLEACAGTIEGGDVVGLEDRLAVVREHLRAVHDAQAQWCWALLTMLRDELGEDAMDDVLRTTEEGWVTARYAALAQMTPREIFEITIEGMRGHLGGAGNTGAVRVHEDDDKYVLEFDPCGTGGRMRRGDPARNEPPAVERPLLFGVTESARDWSWQEEGVCLYCAHCAVVNEILPIEHMGAPMRVTEHPVDPDDPCRWTIYKSPEAVPADAYRRVGKAPPDARA